MTHVASHTKKEDLQFEKIYSPIVQKELMKIFCILYKTNKCEVKLASKENNTDMDRFLAIDARVMCAHLPNATVQIKGRRFETYKYFKRYQDILISLNKIIPPNTTPFNCGDYYKCNSNYYFYCFLDKSNTSLEYWALFNWNKLQQKFISVNGWHNLKGTIVKQIEDKDGIITNCLSVKWEHIQEDCLILDKYEYDFHSPMFDNPYQIKN
jgi:hypothetical protein